MKQHKKKGIISIPITIAISFGTMIIGGMGVYYSSSAKVSEAIGGNATRISVTEVKIDGVEHSIEEIKSSILRIENAILR